MRKIGLAIATASAVVMTVPLFAATEAAAQRVEVGPGGVHVGPRDRTRCRTVTVRTRRPDGTMVTRTERRCGRGGRHWD
jgi:uncharacterized protein YcfJ